MTLPLLCLPGLLCDDSIWSGATLGLRTPVHIARYPQADDLGAIARHLLGEAPERFILAGHSMGGYLAFEILRQAPWRVAGLLLANTSAEGDSPAQAEARARSTRQASADMGRFARGLGAYLLPASGEHAVLLEHFIAMALRAGPARFAAHQAAIAGRPDSMALLPMLDLPCTIIAGADDRVTPPDAARAMAGAIRGSRLVILPETGHLAPLERPAALAEALHALLGSSAPTPQPA